MESRQPSCAAFGGSSASLTAALHYAKAHGGGTVAVGSQSSAAAAILSSVASVAGIGGFSGRESSVSARWLAEQVQLGRLRWVVVDGSQGPRLPGDTRAGSQDAMSVVEKTCKAVTVQSSTGSGVMRANSRRAADFHLLDVRGQENTNPPGSRQKRIFVRSLLRNVPL